MFGKNFVLCGYQLSSTEILHYLLIHIARVFQGRKRDFTGHNFWAKGYFVSTVGRDEKIIREYIKNKRPKTNALTNFKCSKVATF